MRQLSCLRGTDIAFAREQAGVGYFGINRLEGVDSNVPDEQDDCKCEMDPVSAVDDRLTAAVLRQL